MAKKVFHFRKVSIIRDSIEVQISLDKPAERLTTAYANLHANISKSMQTYMPVRTGDFRRRTETANDSMLGTGWLYAGVGPFGRMLYFGKVMVDEKTGRGPFPTEAGPRYREGAKLVASSRYLDLTKGNNPEATAEWYETAKAKDLKKWVAKAQKDLDGG